MGERGRSFVLENYSWENITEQLIETYLEGIERNNSTMV
jgi:glycosyltransferase involved in cell wall biosynthesis